MECGTCGKGGDLSIISDMGKNILFIEDDTFLADILQQSLSQAGFAVGIARDGEEGLTAVKNSKPDLILLDLLLPRLDGFGFLERLRAQPDLASLPVIILSNLMDQEFIQKGKKFGVAAYMIKASTVPDEIIAKIKEVLHL